MDYVDRIETFRGRPLNDEERSEIEQWERGKLLAHIVSTPGWNIAMDTLRSYADSATEQLLSVRPGDSERIQAAHAVAFAAAEIYSKFLQDINRAVDASRSVPETVKRDLRQIHPAGPIDAETI